MLQCRTLLLQAAAGRHCRVVQQLPVRQLASDHTDPAPASPDPASASPRAPPAPQSARQAALRAEFKLREVEWEGRGEEEKLNREEREICARHREAVAGLHFTYRDPSTGLQVLTRLRHFLKGSCCGNACRHCIYDHEAVDPAVKARRRFNSAFWVDRETVAGQEDADGVGESGQFW